MIDAISTTHYSFGKYLSELLNPLTHNDYYLKIPLMQPRELAESFFKSMKMMITVHLTGCCFTIHKRAVKENRQYHP